MGCFEVDIDWIVWIVYSFIFVGVIIDVLWLFVSFGRCMLDMC